jgi:hypothetical protein
LRGTLRVFRRELDASAIGDMEGELSWFAQLLGDFRDCEVQRHRFAEAPGELPIELIMGPVSARIRNDLHAIEFPARGQVSTAMEFTRYLAIMAALRRWRVAPPVDPGIAVGVLRKWARRAQRKADRRPTVALES